MYIHTYTLTHILRQILTNTQTHHHIGTAVGHNTAVIAVGHSTAAV